MDVGSRWVWAFACLSIACSDQGTGPSDAGGSDVAVDTEVEAATQYPSPHPAMAQVANSGGPIMMAPKVVAITYDTDTLQSKIDDFTSKIGTSSYWSGSVAEYGVGALTAMPVHLTESPPTGMLNDGDVQNWLAAKINGTSDAGGPSFPPPDGNTLYAIFYPSGVNLTLMGFPSCNGFDGYHGNFSVGSQAVTYAVLMRCGTVDDLTVAASHEFAESSTDPLSQTKPAYYQPDPNDTVWEYSGGGGELGDMCSAFPGVLYTPMDSPYQVQHASGRTRTHAASHDPCQPNGATPYFNSRRPFFPTDTAHGQRPDGGHVHDEGHPHPRRAERHGRARPLQ